MTLATPNDRAETIHVLHVEDEPGFADLAATFLQREDDRVTIKTTTNAEDGLETLTASTVDCIVSDYDMPGLNGIEFLEAVREQYPNLPFILYTGRGSEEIASEAISAGVTEYLQKESGTGQYRILAKRIENAVMAARAEAELAKTLERVTDAIYTVDTEWRITYVNEGTEEIMGSEEELLGQNLWEEFPEAAEGVIWNKFHEAMDTQEPKSFEVFYEPLDLWASATAYPSETGLTVYFQDVTEKKRREFQLQETTSRLEALFHNSPDMIDVIDSEGILTDVNTRFCTELNYDEEELLGKPIWEIDQLVDEHDVDSLLSDFSLDERRKFDGLYERRDGSTIPVEVHLLCLQLDEENQFLAISRDITDRKEREQELQASQERYESLFTSIRDAIVVADTDRQIINWNPAFANLFGYSRAEIEGKSTTMLYENSQEFEAIGEALKHHEGDPQFTQTITYETKDGNTFPGETNLSYLRDTDGDIVGFIGLIRDNSAREERNRHIKIIDRVLRHNLHNDMNVILGCADQIQASTSGEVASYAEKISEKGRRLLETMDKEREVTKFLADGHSNVSHDIVELVTTTVERLQTRYPDADITIECPDEQNITAVKQFETVIEELIENAIIHSDKETSSVTVRLTCEDKRVQIRITDDGPGIPEMERRVLVEGEEIHPLYHGSGFGLWLVNLFVKYSNGSLTIAENDPSGTVVTVQLPIE